MNNNDNALDPVPPNIPATASTPTFDFDTLDTINTELPSFTVEEKQSTSFDVEHSQESTRARIAVMFTHFFLVIIATAFVGPFVINIIDPTLLNNPVDISKTLVTEVASVLAGPFGFIVGFYFKQGNK